MTKQFDMNPRQVPLVNTKYRKITTEIPARESLVILEQLHRDEPRSMRGQPPIIWQSAKGVNVFDPYGNKWLDFSSGVVVANSGHGNEEIIKAMQVQLDAGLLHTYCFPNMARAELVSCLAKICPDPLKKVFLLSTGSETAECAIKLSRTYGKTKKENKTQIISFDDGFHGRTLGSLLAGGSPMAKKWVSHLDPDIIQVPFPNAFKYPWADEKAPDYSDDKCFAVFLELLKERGGEIDRICAIMGETFQGGWVQLMPRGFVKKLREFTAKHDILLIFDEIQAAFGRTGKLFGFEHYDVVPDIAIFGKGLSSSLPVSAIVGRPDIMDLYGPNEMTSTHSGNPLTSAAALANIRYIVSQKLTENADILGKEIVFPRLEGLKSRFPEIGFTAGVGLAWGIIFVKPGTKDLDSYFAHNVVEKALEKGLLFFAPVGGGATIKITPPLVISREALEEGLAVLEESIEETKRKTD